MKTTLRTLILLTLIVWLGAEIFFPAVAAVSFQQLAPNGGPATHEAGLIVGTLLRMMHSIGIVCGLVLLGSLAVAPLFRIYSQGSVLAPMVLVIGMIAATGYSQFGILPQMERDRISAGGAIDNLPKTAPAHADFDRLHERSTHVEGIVLLFGLLTVVLISRAETVSKA